MIISVVEAKTYLRLELEYTDEDTDITALISAAEGYLKNAGCVLNSDDEVAKLAVKMLVVHWYENREPVGQGNQLAFGLQSIILQLQFAVEVSVATTTTESGGTV